MPARKGSEFPNDSFAELAITSQKRPRMSTCAISTGGRFWPRLDRLAIDTHLRISSEPSNKRPWRTDSIRSAQWKAAELRYVNSECEKERSCRISHSMAPKFIADQLERSRRNLGVETIDVYYLHNPETQLGEVPREMFNTRLRAAFEFLESAVAAAKIYFYGLATWNAFRQTENAQDFLSLAAMESLARDVAGGSHHFRFVQLPCNLGMTEALTRANQPLDGTRVPIVGAASKLGITLVASASMLQGQLSRGLPPFVTSALGMKSDAERAMQFVRSTPGITTALVGMSRVEHVRANLSIVGVPPASQDQFGKLFQRGEKA